MSPNSDRDREPCRLYLVTPPALEPKPFAENLAAALDASERIGAVQLRLKGVDDDAIKRAVAVLRPVAESREVPFLLNDRPDLAAATGCDGVHVGQEDAGYAEARAALGPHAIVGVTCHDSRDLAIDAAEAGADYVAFGAFFPTGTKIPKTRAPIELIEWWAEVMVVPCVAIGGITAANCAPLVKAGADYLAVVSAVWDDPRGPAAAVKELDLAIRRASEDG